MKNLTTNDWLTENLIKKVKQVFEPKYNRSLTSEEIISISENLSGVIEQILKLKWKEKYEKSI